MQYQENKKIRLSVLKNHTGQYTLLLKYYLKSKVLHAILTAPSLVSGHLNCTDILSQIRTVFLLRENKLMLEHPPLPPSLDSLQTVLLKETRGQVLPWPRFSGRSLSPGGWWDEVVWEGSCQGSPMVNQMAIIVGVLPHSLSWFSPVGTSHFQHHRSGSDLPRHLQGVGFRPV